MASPRCSRVYARDRLHNRASPRIIDDELQTGAVDLSVLTTFRAVSIRMTYFDELALCTAVSRLEDDRHADY